MSAVSPYAWGAVPLNDDDWRFRLWAPGADRLTLRLASRDHAMTAEGDGWFSCTVRAEAGAEYAFVLPDGMTVPDPAARRQSGDVHGASRLTRLAPPADGWRGRPWEEAVIYELHVGTFTSEGSFAAAAAEFERLADLGITAVELMPVAQFAGDRGWGYDGVLAYAPHPAYGTPEDLQRLVATAHGHGLMVLLDVVYNHFGPEGNYLGAYAPGFFDETRQTPWGAGIDYTREPVRRFFIENACYWLADYGFDGLRLDAIDQIRDPSSPEILAELAAEVRRRIPEREIHLTTEDNRNVTHLHERGAGGEVTLYTAEWNDDFHNAAHVLATGETDGYYCDFASDPIGLLGRSLAEGYGFQGETGRGRPSAHLPPAAFIDFLQNHDQTGNRAFGDRLAALAPRPLVDALAAILLLSPHVPMVFMGEEYGETRPFLFFAGFEGELADAVRDGRRNEFAGFASFSAKAREVPDPISRETFLASKLDHARRMSPEGAQASAAFRDLLALRRQHIVPRLARTGGDSGKTLVARDGVLAVDWQLDGARLQLRANLGTVPADVPAAQGDRISMVGDADAPPFAAHWLSPE